MLLAQVDSVRLGTSSADFLLCEEVLTRVRLIGCFSSGPAVGKGLVQIGMFSWWRCLGPAAAERMHRAVLEGGKMFRGNLRDRLALLRAIAAVSCLYPR